MSQPKRYALIDGEEVELITDPIELADRFVRQVAERWTGDPDNYFDVFVARYDALTAVAEAARALHGVSWLSSTYDPQKYRVAMSALGAALDALDGGDRG